MVVPTYYDAFRCLAGACRHNCCIGWEIDIDDETLARYRAVPGEVGEQLRRQITGDPPHFVLDNEERCPCLTGENLCGLILTLGRIICARSAGITRVTEISGRDRRRRGSARPARRLRG